MYLNLIYFGNGLRVEARAQLYFNKSISEVVLWRRHAGGADLFA